MARFFITGSSDGLGSLAARALIKRGHSVVLHARNEQRAKDAKAACPDAEDVVVADLTSFKETMELAKKVNDLGKFDGVIHNAGIMRGPITKNEEGVPAIVAVNTFAPYILTCLITKPKHLVYVSSGMHHSGDTTLRDLSVENRKSKWSGQPNYSDTKFHDVLLANAVAARWPDVQSNSLDPGWVATKMGGASAPGSIDDGVATYVHLAEGGNGVTGKYFRDSKVAKPEREAESKELQDRLMGVCEEVTGVKWPGA